MKTSTTFQRKLAIILACATLAVPGSIIANTAQTTDLTITIKGIKGNVGNLMIGVGDLQAPKSMKGNIIKATHPTATTQIREVPSGECTIYIYHDENENHLLDRDEKGVPTEGCAIKKTTIDQQNNSVEIVLYYGKEK